ncbi:MAG: hypothetical protein HQ483_21035 [Rhodospirillales bacterium]|nr:hypothetical protein [Rhodospirillales bacterium]
MIPYSILDRSTVSEVSGDAGRDVPVSLLISIGALRLVNTLERSLRHLRQGKAG